MGTSYAKTSAGNWFCSFCLQNQKTKFSNTKRRRPDTVNLNWGTFLPKSVKSAVLSGSSGSMCRNPLLMNTMFRFGFVDYVGTGMKKICMSQAKRRFPLPEYSFDDGHVSMKLTGHPINETYKTILYHNPDLPLEVVFALDELQKGNEITEEEANDLRSRGFLGGSYPNYYLSLGGVKDTPADVPDGDFAGLNDTQKGIIRMMRENPRVSATEISVSLGLTPRAIKYNIDALSKKNVIKREGTPKSGIWIVNPIR